jgi:hypothetical protein
VIVAASSWEPFVRDLRRIDRPAEWFIERVPADKTLSNELERYRTMAACGWDVVCLVAPDSKTVVALGCR